MVKIKKSEIDTKLKEYLKEVTCKIKIDTCLTEEEKDQQLKDLKNKLSAMSTSEIREELGNYFDRRHYARQCLTEKLLSKFIPGFENAPEETKYEEIIKAIKRSEMWDEKVKVIRADNAVTYSKYLEKWQQAYIVGDYHERIIRPLQILDNIIERVLVEQKVKGKLKKKKIRGVRNQVLKELRALSFKIKWEPFFDGTKLLLINSGEETKAPVSIEFLKMVKSLDKDVIELYTSYRNPSLHGGYRKDEKEFVEFENEETVQPIEYLITTLLSHDIANLDKNSNFNEDAFVKLIESSYEKVVAA